MTDYEGSCDIDYIERKGRKTINTKIECISVYIMSIKSKEIIILAVQK